MKEIKEIIAKNISELRILNNMTQLDLANKLNYSDKAISKWERGESLPDITVLCSIADLFGVPLDALVKNVDIKKINKSAKYNYKIITYISIGFLWTAALFCFVLTFLIKGIIDYSWLYFVYAMPLTLITMLIFNTIWFNKRKNYYFISGILWSVLISVQLTFLYFGIKVYPIYLLGVAGEAIIILWSFIKFKKQ
ncbi:MAG: helix-turn-helix domain-containing protein [Clostridia bacterium]|nr:helix-turn-helix domain-containing protein [Clostridia bacterium]